MKLTKTDLLLTRRERHLISECHWTWRLKLAWQILLGRP